MLRRNKEITRVQQVSIFESMAEGQFKKSFSAWFRRKAPAYIEETLKTYMVGEYKREIPRIILYPLSARARANYFGKDAFYRKDESGPFVIGFKSKGYEKNPFIQDLRPNDICLFLDLAGKRETRARFIDRIRRQELPLCRLTGYKIKERIVEKRASRVKVDDLYWPDEIKSREIIYPYICEVEDHPFISKADTVFPYIESFTENTWEAFSSCAQYGEYREISPLDFAILISKL